MSLDILLLILEDWHWQLKTLLIAAICASYSLAAIWAAQSRDHWIVRGLIVCGLLALLLPPRAHEPLLFFLFMLPTLGALTAWQTWRRPPAPKDAPRQPFQFSLRTLLLGFALASAVLGLAMAALQDRPYIHWLRLPFAAVLIAIVANQAWRIVTARRKLLQLVILTVAMLAWVGAEEFWLEDWLAVGNLFGVWHIPMFTNHSMNMVLLTIHYSEFSLLIALVGAVAKGASSPSLSPHARRLCQFAAASVLVCTSVPCAWVYVQMVGSPKAMAPFVEAENCYPDLVQFAQSAATSPPSKAKLDELLQLLKRPGFVPLDLERDARPSSELSYKGEIRDLARNLQAASENSTKTGRYDEAAEYALANIRMGLVLQRGGLNIDFLTGNAIESAGQYSLATIRDKISAAERTRLIALLAHADQRREPNAIIEERDRIYDDRTFRWVHRLQVVFSGQVPKGMDAQYADFQRRTTAYGRLMATDLAIREFQAAEGRLPGSLDELVPRYLPTLPQDPFSNDPLHYRATIDGVITQSCGRRMVEKGGVLGEKGVYQIPFFSRSTPPCRKVTQPLSACQSRLAMFLPASSDKEPSECSPRPLRMKWASGSKRISRSMPTVAARSFAMVSCPSERS